MPLQLQRQAVIHVRYDGRSFDVLLDELAITDRASDHDVKRAVARHLELAEGQLNDYVLDRHETGNFTIRPQAVFG
jgi:hypothetical protein